MPEKPLLLLPSPVNVPKPAGNGGGAKIHAPDREVQTRRLDPQFTVLDQAFQNKSVVLADNPGSEPPELILVIETVGAVQDFFRAVSLIPELKWQFEWDDEHDPDSEFFDEKYPKKKLNGFAFLMLCNQQAGLGRKGLGHKGAGLFFGSTSGGLLLGHKGVRSIFGSTSGGVLWFRGHV